MNERQAWRSKISTKGASETCFLQNTSPNGKAIDNQFYHSPWQDKFIVVVRTPCRLGGKRMVLQAHNMETAAHSRISFCTISCILSKRIPKPCNFSLNIFYYTLLFQKKWFHAKLYIFIIVFLVFLPTYDADRKVS